MDAAPDVPDTWPLVGVIGAGRVGSAVLRACAAAGVPLLGVASREEVTGRTMAADVGTTYLPALEILRRAELTVLSVPDPLLAQVAADLARGLQDSGGGTTQAGTAPADAMSPAVVHCSGALDAGPLAPLAGLGLRTGAWHPLLAFANRHTALAMDVTWGITADEPLRTPAPADRAARWSPGRYPGRGQGALPRGGRPHLEPPGHAAHPGRRRPRGVRPEP